MASTVARQTSVTFVRQSSNLFDFLIAPIEPADETKLEDDDEPSVANKVGIPLNP